MKEFSLIGAEGTTDGSKQQDSERMPCYNLIGEILPLSLSKEALSYQFYSATNGVIALQGVGDSAEMSYRVCHVPDDWQLKHTDSAMQPRDYAYQAYEKGIAFGIQRYTIDAYAISPLSGGKIMTKNELEQGLKADGQHFLKETSISINDQEWQVGHEENVGNNVAKITFYRLENTENVDDSVIVGAAMYSLEV